MTFLSFHFFRDGYWQKISFVYTRAIVVEAIVC